jgi:hypothetical protein
MLGSKSCTASISSSESSSASTFSFPGVGSGDCGLLIPWPTYNNRAMNSNTSARSSSGQRYNCQVVTLANFKISTKILTMQARQIWNCQCMCHGAHRGHNFITAPQLHIVLQILTVPQLLTVPQILTVAPERVHPL